MPYSVGDEMVVTIHPVHLENIHAPAVHISFGVANKKKEE